MKGTYGDKEKKKEKKKKAQEAAAAAANATKKPSAVSEVQSSGSVRQLVWVNWKDFSADGSDSVSMKVNWTRPPGSGSVNVSVFLCRLLLLLFRLLQLR